MFSELLMEKLWNDCFSEVINHDYEREENARFDYIRDLEKRDEMRREIENLAEELSALISDYVDFTIGTLNEDDWDEDISDLENMTCDLDKVWGQGFKPFPIGYLKISVQRKRGFYYDDYIRFFRTE